MPQYQPTVTSSARSLRFVTVGQFIAVVMIWSLTPLAAVWTVAELHWAWGLFIRFSLAIPIALLCMLYFRLSFHYDIKSMLSYCAGAIGLFGSMTFCYIGATEVPSAIISIIYGISPILSGLMSTFILGKDRFHWIQWLGLGLALLGMCLAIGLGSSEIQMSNFGIMCEIIAMVLYVISTFAVGMVGANIHPITQTAGSTIVSWLGYLCLLPIFWAYLPHQLPNIHTSLAVLYSAFFSSVLAMIFYYALIKKLKPTTVLLITIMTPVLATLWGTWLNQEHLSSHLLLGLILLCSGLFLYTHYRRG
ncbi:MAG: DMT family transporter [Acinetobacter sp.]|nr:MAG: DMT family transporter [Acinetobacter sp.]